MAILQVRNLDDSIYLSLKREAEKEGRSISQEVIKIIQYYFSRPSVKQPSSTQSFLNLNWQGNKSAEKIISEIHASRKNSKRFKLSMDNDIFN